MLTVNNHKVDVTMKTLQIGLNYTKVCLKKEEKMILSFYQMAAETVELTHRSYFEWSVEKNKYFC